MVTYVNVVEKGDAWNCFDWGRAPANDSAGNTWKASGYSADSQWRTLNALLGFGSRTGFTVSGSLYRYVRLIAFFARNKLIISLGTIILKIEKTF